MSIILHIFPKNEKKPTTISNFSHFIKNILLFTPFIHHYTHDMSINLHILQI